MSAARKPAVGLWIRLAKCYALVLREVRDAPSSSDLSLAQFDVLAQLLRHPEGMTAGALSEELLVTAGNVTGLVDRLEAQQLVTRRAAPDDARVRIVKLTAEGKRLAQREVVRHERLLERVFSALDAREQQAIASSLDRIRVALEDDMTLNPQSFAYQLDAGSGVATITFSRPERLNSLTFEVYAELRDTFRALDTEPGVRVVVITGTGRGFCSGGDVETIIGQLFEKDYAGLCEFTRMTCDLIANIRRCRRPVVAALNGTVAGAGAVIAAACDFRIASERAKIAFLFTKVGLCGADMGSAWLLPRLIGYGRATELLMTGDFIDAQEAKAIGLYNKVVADEALPEAARAFAERLAKGPQLGLAMTKSSLEREAYMDFSSALALEAETQAVCMQHTDFREAYEAFMNKRTPQFR